MHAYERDVYLSFKCSTYYWWLKTSFTCEKKIPTMLTHGKRNALLKAASAGGRVYLSFQAAPDLHQIPRREGCCLADEGPWLCWCWFPRLVHTSHILPPTDDLNYNADRRETSSYL